MEEHYSQSGLLEREDIVLVVTAISQQVSKSRIKWQITVF